MLIHSPYKLDLVTFLPLINEEEDDLLLLSDGVIAGIKNSIAMRMLESYPIKLYALKSDIIARGLPIHYSSDIRIITYSGLVKLTEKHKQQLLI